MSPDAHDARPHPPEYAPGRPLTRSEIDGIVGALRTESPVDTLVQWMILAGPFAAAMLPRTGPDFAGILRASRHAPISPSFVPSFGRTRESSTRMSAFARFVSALSPSVAPTRWPRLCPRTSIDWPS